MADLLMNIKNTTYLAVLVLLSLQTQSTLSQPIWRNLFAGTFHATQYALAAGIPTGTLLYKITAGRKQITELAPTVEAGDEEHKKFIASKLPDALKSCLEDGSLELWPYTQYGAAWGQEHNVMLYDASEVETLLATKQKLINPLYRAFASFFGIIKEDPHQIEEKENEIAFKILHESAHIFNKDNQRMAMCAAIASHAIYFSPKLLSKRQSTPLTTTHFLLKNLGRIPLGGCQFVLTAIALGAFSQYQEYQADMYAAHTCNNPKMIRATAQSLKNHHTQIIEYFEHIAAMSEDESKTLPINEQAAKIAYKKLIQDNPNSTLAPRLFMQICNPTHPYVLDRANYLEAYAERLEQNTR